MNFPLNNSWTNKTAENFRFNFSFLDPDSGSAGCYLRVNGVERNMQSANNMTWALIQSAVLNEGKNIWNITCETDDDFVQTGNMTLYVDRGKPQVSVLPAELEEGNPLEYDDYNLLNVVTGLYANDTLSPNTTCRLFFNDSSEAKNVVNVGGGWFVFVGLAELAAGIWHDSAVIDNGTLNLLFSPAYDGKYKWWVNCTDLAGNTDGSAVSSLNMKTPDMLSVISPEEMSYDSPNDIAVEYYIFFDVGNLKVTSYLLDGKEDEDINIDTLDPPYSALHERYEVSGTFDAGGPGFHNITIIAFDISLGIQNTTLLFTVDGPDIDSITIESPGNVISSTSTTVKVVLLDDANGCNISLDDNENVTMHETSGTEWTYYATGLSEGEHDIVVWCYPETGSPLYAEKTFFSYSGDYGISISYPENKTYWETDLINLSVTATRDSEYCTATLDSGIALLMKHITDKKWYQLFSELDNGHHSIKVSCQDMSENTVDKTVHFSSYDYECIDNQTGMCAQAQWCSGNNCVALTCSGCSHASDHKCIPYECCENDECLNNQECADNICKDIECDCGVIEEHECVEYECCSNFDCGSNEICNTGTNTCIAKGLKILSPDSITSGQQFTVTVLDHNMDPVPGAKVKIEYPSGKLDSLTTNSQGSATFVAAETGSVSISADMPGYEKVTSYIDVEAGVDLSYIFAIILFIIMGGGGFFYWKNLPPLKLSKHVNGQNITLKVKNRTGEYIENVLVSDSVPTGSYISGGLTPNMEVFGPETHLTWFAALNPGEEIMISYQSRLSTDGFITRVGDDEYSSEVGFMNVFSDLFSKLRKSKPPSELYQ
ncbi:MAG: carboxypeptidase regulatory-like domain-containing protein [Candidatus Aenigmarchaeota archaeon]|nr:carboxypeptidase regulatory-like domain-containing protein [Candidatus Aenigmarchaeota archaeon]